jgi:hypothetical protein
MRTPVLDILKILCLAAAVAVAPALGQVEQTTRVVGTVERVDGANLTIKAAQSERVVNVPPDATVFAMVKADLADIKPGAFIGVGATPQADDSQRAIRSSSFRNPCAGWAKAIGRGTGPAPR